MSLQTPTVSDINATIIAQLQATLNQTIPLLPKSFLRVLSKVFAAVYILLYKYSGWISLQQFVKTASMEDVEILGQTLSPLKFWGQLIGVGDPTAATQAELQITITVNTQGGTLASGTQLVNADNGVTYLLVGSVLLSAPTVTGNIRAASDQGGGNGAGTIGNLVAGDIVSFANPLAVVARDATVTAQVTTGADQEDTEVYRQRIFDRFQKRAQGGALIDYEIWGEGVAGIISVYPYTGALPGHVDTFVEATVASSGDPDGIPTAAQLAAVAAAYELDDNGLASRRPAGAFVNTDPITRTGFDLTVLGLLVSIENLASVQAQIQAAVVDYFLAREPFVSGVTLPPRTDTITKSSLIGLVEDIVTAADGTFTSINYNKTGFGVNLISYTLGQGEKAKLTGSVTF